MAGESLMPDLCTMSEFVARHHGEIDYLVPYVVVAGQPGVISARAKSLKTTIAIDLSISMATGSAFLAQWHVPRPVKCGILTAESGDATVDETIRRVAASKGIELDELDNCVVSTRCPRLQSVEWLDEIRRVIESHELRCLTIDPTYLAFAGIDQNRLSAVAEALSPISDIIADTGCSIVMVHHNRKVTEARYGCPTLEEITGSGFAEWARFWVLLNRRREWDDATGRHWLWLVTGGSAGFGSRKWLDVREAKPTDIGGRVWEVEVCAAAEGENRERQERDRQREETREAQTLDHQRAVVDAIRICGGRATKEDIKTRTNIKTDPLGAALAALLDRGDVIPADVPKTRGRSFPGFQLVE